MACCSHLAIYSRGSIVQLAALLTPAPSTHPSGVTLCRSATAATGRGCC